MAEHINIKPEAVLLSVETTYPNRDETNANPNQQRRCFAVRGNIEAIGTEVTGLRSGDQVLTLYNGGSENVPTTLPSTLTIAARNIISDIPKPSQADEDAVSLLHAAWSSAAILKQELDLPIPASQTERKPEDRLYGKRVFILGGETALGTAMVKLLHTVAPDVKIAVTAVNADKIRLQIRTIASVQLGARYAIDGAAEDLVNHLKADIKAGMEDGTVQDRVGVDAIIDTNRCLDGDQKALLDLLLGERTVIDCKAVDFERTMRRMLQDGKDFVGVVGGFVRDISEVFASIPEDELTLECPNSS